MADEPMNDDPLNLKDLPALDPPEPLWHSISRTLDEQAVAQPSRPRWLPLVAAAGVAVLALCLGLMMQGDTRPDAASREQGTLARLQAVSASLERELDTYRDGVVSATTADSVARIEQELAWLDAQINRTPEDAALWVERIALLDEMNQRYSKTMWRNQLMLASY